MDSAVRCWWSPRTSCRVQSLFLDGGHQRTKVPDVKWTQRPQGRFYDGPECLTRESRWYQALDAPLRLLLFQ